MSESYQKLLEGNKTFRENEIIKKELEKLSQGQWPKFFWIGCSDSRVSPNLITASSIGEVFVYRNVANQVRRGDLAMESALEYAVNNLGVEHIIVCGHHSCGGVNATVNFKQLEKGAIREWLTPFKSFIDQKKEITTDIDQLAELAAIEQAYQLSQHPIIQDAWKSKSAPKIHAFIYKLKSGELSLLKSFNSSQQKES